MNKPIEEESYYCSVCGGCGYTGCCGVYQFLDMHVKGKTNCKNEAQFIEDIKDLFQRNEEELNKELNS